LASSLSTTTFTPVAKSNIAGFVKVADAMLDQGVV
jgi:glutamate dehydrogenase/leucine dehydrogenase